ncbi:MULTISPECIES: hypothetical protein [unclassified Oleiphilus]|jgi:hypothetical protein|nr:MULTISPECIES: hypothetical protein [unclassified Oleiphilus]KZY46574.1 hypothetical protein A3732_07510 [Oleiphilus sp. HI0050]KZY75668.1 hypothetical protein A3740_14835 [Oleiphilus sp. HI0068]KZY80301.1 hypothetical protein A3741_05770 [Oleiphilus sp. HI0069]KZY95503.1 hypothetical protein A3743_05405 [Oleiphilus sp. HI0072]KZY28769.1 hypothetical protein A3729_13010 [Oleiphilus sp. HI0043]
MKYDSSAVSKYLDTYAEPDIQALQRSLERPFDAVLVIPVYDEPITQLLKIIDKVSAHSAVLIFVFNAPDVDEPEVAAAQQRTREALESLVKQTQARQESELFRANISSTLTLYCMSYCHAERLLSPKQGVGLARKLGMDLGLKLVQQQYLSTGKLADWLHSSDADVSLPESYFNISVDDSSAAAAIYPFKHIAELGYETAMSLYDHSLRYYVDQLQQAGSPYAFHTIGSLIAVSPIAYALVRGFPKRSAGEDFYLLNKLAKVGRIHSLEAPTIEISGRPSHRVPFGTGPALLKISRMEKPDKVYTFYHPQCFKLLKKLLSIISNSGQSFSSAELLFEAIKDTMSDVDSAAVIQALCNLKIEKQFKHLSQKRDSISFQRAFHIWFDAFVTLRFIHEVRDSHYPNVSFNELPELSSEIDR